MRSTTTYLVDMDGKVVHTWPSSCPPGNSVYLLENGHLLRTGAVFDNPVFRGGGMGGRVQEIDWDGNVVWDYAYSDADHLQHHDVEPLPNGNVLILAWERKTREEAIDAGRDPSLLGDGGEMWPDHVVEVKPKGKNGGEIVWEWHAWDHLIQDHDPAKKNWGVVADHPELIDINADRERTTMSEEETRRLEALGYIRGGDRGADGGGTRGPDRGRRGPGGGPPGMRGGDWTHVNSVDYHPGLDQIALSVHTLSEIWVIDHGTTTEEASGHSGGRGGKGGDLLYRWGNPQAYRAGTEEERRLFRQHDVRWIDPGRPGEGNFLLFNNGAPDAGRAWSSVDEIVPPLEQGATYARGANKTFGPEVAAWSYTAPNRSDLFASHISGASRLPNGNTLVCDGEQGRIFEVTPDGTTVWDYLVPVSEADAFVPMGGMPGVTWLPAVLGLRPIGGPVGMRPPGMRPPGIRPGEGRPMRGRPGDGRRFGEGPPDDRPPGEPPTEDRPGGDRPQRGPARGRPGNRGGPGPGGANGLFRAERYAPDYPGLARLTK